MISIDLIILRLDCDGGRTLVRYVDAHVHFWDRQRFNYPWLEQESSLPDSFQPRDLRTAGGDADAVVFVEADCLPRQSLAEAAWAADLVATFPSAGAVVAFAPIGSGDALHQWIERLRRIPSVRGVRRLLQNEPVEFVKGDAMIHGLKALADAGLTFDACVRHQQLPALLELRRAAPEAVIVVDHLGKPPIADGWGSAAADDWLREIGRLAQEERTFIKVSGVTPEAGPCVVLEQARPFIEAVTALFGPARTMAGSDWPVSAAPAPAPTYRAWFDFIAGGIGLSESEADLVLASTAEVAYSLRGGDGPDAANSYSSAG